MRYSWDKFLRPFSMNDVNVQVMNDDGVVTHTINPSTILNVMVNNNLVKVSLKSGRVVIIPFSTLNEAKMALPRIKQLISDLNKRTGRKYLNKLSKSFYYQSNIPDGTYTDFIEPGSFWYDTEFGFLYIYILDNISGYNWVTAVGEIGPQGDPGLSAYEVWLNEGNIGSLDTFFSSISGTSGTDGTSGTSYTPTSGSWILSPGSNTVSFTVPVGNSYVMWVNGNIPNGIINWNATVTISNINVPVIGNQYGWYYLAGNQLVLDSIPSHIIGTSGSIITTDPNPVNSNTFTFGITNNTSENQMVYYGYIKVS